MNGYDEELTSILSVCPIFSNKKDNKDKTPLHYAIEGKYPSTCEILLDFGADMFMTGNRTRPIGSLESTPLNAASEKEDIIQLLIERIPLPCHYLDQIF